MNMYVCIYSENQTTPKTFTALEAYSWHSFVCPSSFPLPLPFTVISQIESNDVPSMSKNTFSFCLPGHIYACKALTEGICVYKSTFFAALSYFGTLENQQNKRRNSNLLEAQTYKLLCVCVLGASTNGVSLAGLTKTMRRQIDNATPTIHPRLLAPQTSWSASS